MISFQEIEKLAELARIKLSEKEKKELQSDMRAILNYFKKLQELNFDIKSSEEFFTVSNLNEIRNDESPSRLNTDENQEESAEILLKQFSERKNGYLKVKKIL